MKGFIVLVFLSLWCLDTQSQSRIGNWQQYFNTAKIGNGDIRIQTDIQHRDHNLFGDLDQVILRSGLQYFHRASNLSGLAGYAYFIYQNEGEPNVTITEHRLHQDIDLHHKAGRIQVRHRYRFEERFVQNTPFAFRLRYATIVNVPINNKKMEPKTLYAAFWNEVFINTQGSAFDRDWLYAGLGYKVSDNLGFQIGAMNQFRESGPKAQIILGINHTMHLTLEKE